MEYKLYNPTDELTHWGIKGMRWGVRRYQNKDGSLTPAGKKRLKAESEALKKEEQVLKNRKSTMAKFTRLANKRKALEEQKKELEGANAKTKKSSGDAAKPAQKSIKDMTDAELNAAVNRARLEDAYRQLRPEPVNEKHPLMKKMINEVVVPAAVNSGKKFLENALNKAGEDLLKGKTDPNSIEALTKVRDKLKLVNEIDKLRKGKADDDNMSWDEKLKKQQYERNKKKYDAEDAAEASKSQTSSNNKTTSSSNNKKTKTSSNTRTDDSETIFGEFVSGGSTRQKASSTTKKTTHDIIDAEFEDITPSRVKNYPATYQGRTYITGLLTSSNLPARRDDD